jgi:hypothetical protein
MASHACSVSRFAVNVLNKSEKHRGQMLGLQHGSVVPWGVFVSSHARDAATDDRPIFPLRSLPSLSSSVPTPDYNNVMGTALITEVHHHKPVTAIFKEIEDVKCRADVTIGVTAACFTVFNAHSTLNDMKFSRDGAMVKFDCFQRSLHHYLTP